MGRTVGSDAFSTRGFANGGTLLFGFSSAVQEPLWDTRSHPRTAINPSRSLVMCKDL
jgi:hypothetical protein